MRDLYQVDPDLLHEIEDERTRQDDKWGGPEHDDQHDERAWIGYIRDHNIRALGQGEFRKQMVRLAALAVAALESYDRKHPDDA